MHIWLHYGHLHAYTDANTHACHICTVDIRYIFIKISDPHQPTAPLVQLPQQPSPRGCRPPWTQPRPPLWRYPRCQTPIGSAAMSSIQNKPHWLDMFKLYRNCHTVINWERDTDTVDMNWGREGYRYSHELGGWFTLFWDKNPNYSNILCYECNMIDGSSW